LALRDAIKTFNDSRSGAEPAPATTPTTEPTPSAATASDASPAAPAPTPAAPVTTPAPRVVKVKVDGKEEDVDLDATYSDETKRAELAQTIQKGRNYDREGQRRYAEGQKALADNLARRGYTFKPKVANPQTLDDYEVIPPQAAAPTQPGAPVTTPDPELDALAKEEAELKPKIAGEYADPDAVLRLAEIRSERKMIQRDRAARAKADAEQAKMREEGERTTRQAAVESAVVGAINSKPGVFENVPERDADRARVVIFQLATKYAKAENMHPSAVPALVTGILDDIERVISARVAAKVPARPAPPPAPTPMAVIGAGGGGGAPTTTKTPVTLKDHIQAFMANGASR